MYSYLAWFDHSSAHDLSPSNHLQATYEANALSGGIELGLGSRLAPNYKVVKKDKDDVESKPGTVDKVPIAQATDNGASGKTPTVQTVRNGGS